MSQHFLTIVGLGLQILGAFFLAKGVIWKAPRYLMRELIGVPVERFRTFRHYIAGRIEVILGFVLLSVGAGFQMAAEVRDAGPEAATGLVTWILACLLGIGVIATALYFVVRRLAKRVFLEIFVEQVRRRHWPFQEDPELLGELGEILDLPRTEDDTVDTYQSRIRERLGLPPRGAGKRRRTIEEDDG